MTEVELGGGVLDDSAGNDGVGYAYVKSNDEGVIDLVKTAGDVVDLFGCVIEVETGIDVVLMAVTQLCNVTVMVLVTIEAISDVSGSNFDRNSMPGRSDILRVG